MPHFNVLVKVKKLKNYIKLLTKLKLTVLTNWKLFGYSPKITTKLFKIYQ